MNCSPIEFMGITYLTLEYPDACFLSMSYRLTNNNRYISYDSGYIHIIEKLPASLQCTFEFRINTQKLALFRAWVIQNYDSEILTFTNGINSLKKFKFINKTQIGDIINISYYDTELWNVSIDMELLDAPSSGAYITDLAYSDMYAHLFVVPSIESVPNLTYTRINLYEKLRNGLIVNPILVENSDVDGLIGFIAGNFNELVTIPLPFTGSFSGYLNIDSWGCHINTDDGYWSCDNITLMGE